MPTPHITPPGNAIYSTWQIGTYNAVTDTFTVALDLNDRTTWYVRSYDIPQPEKVVSRSGNPRTQGERITNEVYKNRYITLTLSLRSTTTIAAIDTAIHSLEAAIDTTPFMIRFAEPGAAQYSYAIVKSWVHSIPQDSLQRLAKVKTGITIVFECEPGLLGDKQYLDNLIVNPGFEAPSGPGVQVFNDTFANTNAYASTFGSAPTTPASNTFVDSVINNGGANLLRYYRLGLGDTASVALDIAGTNQTGTPTGSPTQGVAGLVSGDTDTCYTFAAASSQYVDCPVTGLPTGNSPIALGIRQKFAANPAANQFLITYGAAASGAHNTIGIFLDSTGHLNASVGTGVFVTSGVVTTGANHSAVTTWDGTTLKLYVDGVSVGTPITPGAQTIPTSAASNRLRIAATADTTAAGFYSGQLDEAMVWNADIGATAISNIHTAANTGATGTTANTMVVPLNSRVAFGSPSWGAINSWQVRFRWVTGLTAQYYLHFTDGNNYLRCQLAAGSFVLQQAIAGVLTTLATGATTLQHETWYWVSITQFPIVPGGAPYVQATLFYDAAGAVGSVVTNGAIGPFATQDAVTALIGKPQIMASGAALAVGGNFTNVHVVGLFGPGGWFFAGVNASSGLAALGWDQNTSNTYPNGPVTSFGAARIDIAPAGTTDARLSTWDGFISPIAQYGIPTSQNHVLGYSVAVKSSGGLSVTSTVQFIVKELNSSGTGLVDGTITLFSGTNPAGWNSYSGTYTIQNAATAYVRIQLRVNDATANSANATVWFDNVQLWDQTTNGGQTSMPYCELRFPQSPAHLMVSGLVGDVPVPAVLAFGSYVASGASNNPYSFAIGRRALSTAGAVLAGAAADAPRPNASCALDATSYGGFYMRSTGQPYSPIVFSASPATYQGVYQILTRAQTEQIVGNLSKVTAFSSVITVDAPWELPGTVFDSYGSTATAPFKAQSTWTIVNCGVTPIPTFPRGPLTDLTQNFASSGPQITDANSVSAPARFNWGLLLPIDSSKLAGQVQLQRTITTQWLWIYFDGSGYLASALPATGYSTETGALANIAHAAGGAGQATVFANFGNVTIISTAEPYLTLDPRTQIGSVAVNQMGMYLSDSNTAVMGVACSLQYTPQYLDPR